MRKLNLKAVVIVIPLISAVVFGLTVMQRREAARKSEYHFRRQAREGRLLEVHRIMRDLTPARAEDLLRMATESPWVCYDGDARLAQVRKAELVWEQGPQDSLYLLSLDKPGRWHGYSVPVNASVESVCFEGNFLNIGVSGQVADGVMVPTDSPITIRLPWAGDLTTPPKAPIEQMLLAAWAKRLKGSPATTGSAVERAE